MRPAKARSALVLAALVFAGPACDAPEPAERPAAADDGAPAPAAADASPAGDMRLDQVDFVLGTWRGRTPEGATFHERYTLADDSTIAVQSFEDSTLSDPEDIGEVALRRGVLYRIEGSGSRTAATRADSAGVLFGSTARGFTFAPRPDGGWTATLHGARGPGPEGEVVYTMEPVDPAGP